MNGSASPAKLTYSALASLDGYIEDKSGGFGWAEPDEEVHAFANELERSVGTHMYGRRMYEVMRFWEDSAALPADSQLLLEFAEIWQAADKIVYSTTLEETTSARTRLEREFVPDAVRALKSESTSDLSIGGPELAAHAIRAGLVDEFHLFVVPVVVGGGKPWLPDDVHIELELRDHRRFGGGVVYLRYAAVRAQS